MLEDGSISRASKKYLKSSKKNARYAMTMDKYSYNYLSWLFNNIFSVFSSSSLNTYANTELPQHKGKAVTQYTFYTQSLPIFTRLHSLWYNYDSRLGIYIKIVPLCIKEIFSSVSLAHWIIQDGYFDAHGRTQTIILCTESFTKTECVLLQEVLKNMGIKSTLKIRNKEKDTYRIRIS